jgi:hypothetical protein
MDDEEIRTLVAGLARPHRSGGDVIERAAILAAGAQSTKIVNWIVAHHGQPEDAAAPASARGLHGARFAARTADRPPLRYVLPAGTLTSRTR